MEGGSELKILFPTKLYCAGLLFERNNSRERRTFTVRNRDCLIERYAHILDASGLSLINTLQSASPLTMYPPTRVYLYMKLSNTDYEFYFIVGFTELFAV